MRRHIIPPPTGSRGTCGGQGTVHEIPAPGRNEGGSTRRLERTGGRAGKGVSQPKSGLGCGEEGRGIRKVVVGAGGREAGDPADDLGLTCISVMARRDGATSCDTAGALALPFRGLEIRGTKHERPARSCSDDSSNVREPW